MPHLYQGGYPPPGMGLRDAGVDVLVLCAKEHQRADMYPGVAVILAPGDDDLREHRLQRFIETWKRAANQVAEQVRNGKNVLVTCMAGQNRSGLVVSLALRELTGMSGEEIVGHVQRSRPLALNNTTFVKYVIDSFPDRALPRDRKE